MEPLSECPYCGSKDCYEFRDAATLVYVGEFGKGRQGEEFTNFEHQKPSPKRAKCGSCGKWISLKKLRGEK